MKKTLFRTIGLFVILFYCFICGGCTDFGNESSKTSDKSEGINSTMQPTSTAEEMYAVTIKVDFRENLLLNKYDVKLFLDGNLKETMAHGKGTDIETKTTKGEHLLRVENEQNPDVFGELTITINEESIVSVYVRTEKEYITVEVQSIEAKNTPTPTEEPTPTPTEAPTPTGTPLPTETPTPTVEALHTLDFTSNDNETAKNGNSGEFSYVFRGGNSIYLVFDFDSGYAYLWEVGNDTQFYIRMKIISGDLNSGVSVIGYIDPNKPYTIQVKCKNAGDPSILVGSDSDGASVELAGFRLEDAHTLMNQRFMVDVSKKLDPTPTPTIGENESLEFTSNDAKTVLNGNSGLYSYSGKEQSGVNLFIIFDLDNGYVYYFSDNNEEDYYARFLIESGNLRDGVVCKIYNSKDTITWNVKFQSDNSANEIEIAASTGATVQVKGTNLNSALELMQTKYMLDRSIPTGQSTENTPTPSLEPTNTPTPLPTNTPTPVPTNTPTPLPTNTPTPVPTNTPTPTSTPVPTNTPTPVPTNTPTPTPKKESVYYSTNDKKTVKNGNSGVYSYKDQGKNGTANYLVIDFDEGYVYWFQEVDSYYDRTKLVSGDLNAYVLMTYYDRDSSWSYGLHFKWVNQPDILIMQDQYGYEYKYTPTDLDDALKLMEGRIMQDFSKKKK